MGFSAGSRFAAREAVDSTSNGPLLRNRPQDQRGELRDAEEAKESFFGHAGRPGARGGSIAGKDAGGKGVGHSGHLKMIFGGVGPFGVPLPGDYYDVKGDQEQPNHQGLGKVGTADTKPDLNKISWKVDPSERVADYHESGTELEEKVLTQKEREKSATVGSDRYPMPDKEHAKLALNFIDKGGLSPEEKAKVSSRAHKILGAKEAEAYEAWVGLIEADRGIDGKFKNDLHTSHAREHILAASIALNGNDLGEARRRIGQAIIHSSHSQHSHVQQAVECLENADDKVVGKNAHLAAEQLDKAYGHLQGEPHTLLQLKKTLRPVREAMIREHFTRERLTIHPTLIEGSYDPTTRTADVIILTEGRGNSRDKHYYTADCIREAATLGVFNAAQAYADHPSRQEDIDRPERSIRDLIGYYHSTYATQYKGRNALAGKLRIIEGADFAVNLIRESIDFNKRFPDKVFVGISINADGDTAPGLQEGQDVNLVHHITEAFSADVVTKPARGGTFLKLVESARRESNMKYQEAVARLEQLKAGGDITKEDFAECMTALKEAKVTEGADAGNGKSGGSGSASNDELEKHGSSKNKVALDQMSESQRKAYESLDEADKPKFAEAFTKKAAGKTDGTTDPEDANEKTVEAKGDTKVTESERKGGDQSDLAKKFPTMYEAALREATHIVGAKKDQKIDAVLQENAELRGRIALTESVGLAGRLLKESALPENAHEKVLRQIVGLTEGEMRDTIRAEERYLESVGVSSKDTKETDGAGATVRVRESAANTDSLLANIYKE